MNRTLMTILITVTIAASLVLTGCSTDNSQVLDGKVEAKASKKLNGTANRVTLRCESTLTRSGKPCQNKVREDSYCHLHEKLEDARTKAIVKELEAGTHITEESKVSALFDR